MILLWPVQSSGPLGPVLAQVSAAPRARLGARVCWVGSGSRPGSGSYSAPTPRSSEPLKHTKLNVQIQLKSKLKRSDVYSINTASPHNQRSH